MTEPFAWWSAEQIADATRCPKTAVETHWPKIFEQMELCRIQTPNTAIGIIGTTAIEGASTFAPVSEGCYLGEPEPAHSHRLTLPYAPFWGRGHIQLTHESNYRKFGPLVADLWGVSSSDPAFDLVAQPDRALDPDVAAAVISLYFRDTRALPTASWPQGYSLIDACEARDWEWVRILVYGGVDLVGATRIDQIAAALGQPAGEVPIVPPTDAVPSYDNAEPAISQNDQWSCAPTSARWCLTAYGRQPSESWVENSMIAEGVVSTGLGLLNATGQDLARWFERHYGEFGYAASHQGLISFDELATEAATKKHPMMVGGRSWYHWSGVRGFDGTKILLANPASGYMGVTQTLSREQFNYLGSFSMVRLVHPAAEAGTVPMPPEPTDPLAPWAGTVGSGLLSMMAADQTLPAQRSSTWLPLGVTPSDIEQCAGQNGVQYQWQLLQNKGFRYAPV